MLNEATWPRACTPASVRLAPSTGTAAPTRISTPLEVCEQRDRKGLYAKARAGEISDFTGISSPYDAPNDADLVIDASAVSAYEAADLVKELLKKIAR
ncbi:MAG: adenylyl-sulfate kinase [Planctomycetota bacterium]